MMDPLIALTDTRPQLRAVRTAAQALGLAPFQLLHAGPPLADPCRPPHTLASSIVMTCLHEGWVADEAGAEALLRSGRLLLSPAQAHDCVTPLAAVVSAGTPVFEVADARGGGPVLHAPVSAVRGVDTRMGFRDPTLLERLRVRDTVVAPGLQAQIDSHGPADLWPMAVAGLQAGDDLHGSTAQANAAWVAWLRRCGATVLADDIAATPLFFLSLWMAACALILRRLEVDGPAGMITRAGGNGERFAIAGAARPGEWVACDATAPQGPRLPGVAADVPIEGAIGDSAVIDMLGLGGQRLAQAPDLLKVFGEAVTAGLHSEPARRLLAQPHPLLPDGWPLGLDAARVCLHRQPPRVVLGMLARDGRGGLCGRGLYRPPLDLFQHLLDGNG
jgi:Protein of unknown function (DUF1116)